MRVPTGKIKLVPDESLTGQRVVNLPLPDDIRPRVEADFEVECGTGTTVVTVMPDGSVLVDPNVGWFSLEGITFQLGGG